jgi:hypothetical protein
VALGYEPADTIHNYILIIDAASRMNPGPILAKISIALEACATVSPW